MHNVKHLTVKIDHDIVGTLATHDGRTIAFEYDTEWLARGFSISPFSLPLEKRVFIPKLDPFEGVFGIFADSLPDGWGRLLLDRHLATQNIDPRTIDEITRLAIVGASGAGSLTYEPSIKSKLGSSRLDLDALAQDALTVLRDEDVPDLDTLFELGGSSGGARPKVLVRIDDEDWIIKFASHVDPPDIGVQEMDYAEAARACGIDMSETRLFSSQRVAGYFGTKRFDRVRTDTACNTACNTACDTARDTDIVRTRVHMASVSALLETSHRYPTLDYHALMRLTLELTRDFEQVEQMYRRMCFNVFAHNRDDHAKNFAFLFLDGRWQLSPAYDLTRSSSIRGEHATSVNGNGRNPTVDDLCAVGHTIGLSARRCRTIADEVAVIVADTLSSYLRPAI
ncbi:MAG: type II toxin-antitoxin system HipA family toxin [Coriobacteriia bacterium]|nr:type II toxin-antitoxin system HipA family toxin [Coriobacteriia bacterium]